MINEETLDNDVNDTLRKTLDINLYETMVYAIDKTVKWELDLYINSCTWEKQLIFRNFNL